MKIALACLAGLLAVATPAFAATDNYVSTSNTGSCATTAGLKGFFEATSFGFSGSDAATLTASSGVSAGKLSFDKFQLLKSFDSCSGVLLTEFLQQSRIPSVTLESKQTSSVNGTGQIVLTITLTNALLTQYSLASSGTDSALQENLAFQFQKACITTYPVATISAAKSSTMCFDTTTNHVSTQ